MTKRRKAPASSKREAPSDGSQLALEGILEVRNHSPKGKGYTGHEQAEPSEDDDELPW